MLPLHYERLREDRLGPSGYCQSSPPGGGENYQVRGNLSCIDLSLPQGQGSPWVLLFPDDPRAATVNRTRGLDLTKIAL